MPKTISLDDILTTDYTIAALYPPKAIDCGSFVILEFAFNNGDSGIPMNRITAFTPKSSYKGVIIIGTQGNASVDASSNTVSLDVPGFFSSGKCSLDCAYATGANSAFINNNPTSNAIKMITLKVILLKN